MSLKKRVQKKARRVYDKTHGGIEDFATGVGHKVSDAAKRTGEKARAGYQRYKDPLIIGTSTALGAIIGSIVPVIGTAAGAGLGLSLSTAAVGANKARKQEQATKQAEKDFDAQTAGLEAGGLTSAIRRRRLQRGAGDAVATYDSDTAPGGFDTQEIAA